MNPYAILASGTDTSTSPALAARLTAWHDAMVTHERRLRDARAGDVCDDECPHVEARLLWAEALSAFGERAHELPFLRSRATSVTSPVVKTALRNPAERTGSEHSGRESTTTLHELRRQQQRGSSPRPHPTKEAEL
jgi:hypothetical protein